MKNKIVYLTGRDFVNWATDDDYFSVKKALNGSVIFTDNIEEADIIHSINWHALLTVPNKYLNSKTVYSHVPHDVRYMLTQPEYLKVAPFINRWLVSTKTAKYYMDLMGLPCSYVPYIVSNKTFYKIDDDEELDDLKEQLGLPKDKYLIGSFQRDTEGADLTTPKYIKGPDIFFEIIKKAYSKNKNIHVVLAGPRRFWLKNKFTKANIPFTFIGKEIIHKDDLNANTLGHSIINELYNVIDLYIVSSRMEGGPKAVLECMSTGTPIISTPVGQSVDLLEQGQLFYSINKGVDVISGDIKDNFLNKYEKINYEKLKSHSVSILSEKLNVVYESTTINNSPNIIVKDIYCRRQSIKEPNNLFNKLFKRKIYIHYKTIKGPWGGANQFIKALSKVISKKRYSPKNIIPKNKTVLINSFHFDDDVISSLSKNNIIHRIDGPTYLVRGKDKKLDDKLFKLNRQIADITIFQSNWSFFKTLELGYKPVNPVIITNAVNDKLFNQSRKNYIGYLGKIKLISTSWSDNPRKGGVIYKWLDENLDFTRFDYTFIGRCSEPLNNIRIISPLNSFKLAKYLKKSDIYITASDNDPCSNALIEAMACGLPAIYYNRGGHSEIVKHGGLGFERAEDIPILIDKIVDDYYTFKNLIQIPSIDQIAEKYLKCFKMLDT